jgi:hypothetical protein
LLHFHPAERTNKDAAIRRNLSVQDAYPLQLIVNRMGGTGAFGIGSFPVDQQGNFIMRLRYLVPLAAIAAIGFAAGNSSSVSAASATAIPAAKADVSMAELVQHRADRRKWRYERHRHGKRYHRRFGNYRHYHDGWWYSRPFWRIPGFGLGITIDPGNRSNAHVAWCEDRYRSYNPRTDMYLGYDGDYHYCNSPYR